MATDIAPFSLSVEESKLELLRKKLELTTFPDELEDSDWDYGTPLTTVKGLIEYWKSSYNWRAAEARINELPQYQTIIAADGFEPLKIHFVYRQSKVPDAVPLLFAHGWPGSFLEVEKLIPLLAQGDEANDLPAFHIVAPSLPNFGFSEGTKKKGFGMKQYAETCHRLMLKLGYSEYVTQGGDWGSMITRTMGLLYPQSCKASHINMVRSLPPTPLSNPFLVLQYKLGYYTEAEKKGLQRTRWFVEEGSGYRLEQSTKPQTIGYSQTDSPVGLLSWILEKLHDWTDNYPWTNDEILTWVSIYMFSTAGPAAANRIYYESIHTKEIHRDRTNGYIPHVKLGLAYFPRELVLLPKSWGKMLGPVVLESFWEKGGHFAATENPRAIAGDLQKMFGRRGGAYKAVKGKTGYAGVRPKL